MKKYLVIGLIAVTAVVAFVVLKKYDSQLAESVNSANDTLSESVAEVADDKLATTQSSGSPAGALAQEGLPAYKGEPVNHLGADATILSQLASDKVKDYQASLDKLAVSLAEHAADYDGWISVGIYKKFFNNYLGARDAWKYAVIVAPENPKAHLNLASLYAYYLKDPVTAERYYLEAFKYDSQNFSNSYQAIAGFYRDFDQKEEAVKYYKQFLTLNPDDAAVKAEIERLQNSGN